MELTPEPTEADVNAEYPCWRTWTGADGLCRARRAEGAMAVVEGEDWMDLRDEIRRAEAFLEFRADPWPRPADV